MSRASWCGVQFSANNRWVASMSKPICCAITSDTESGGSVIRWTRGEDLVSGGTQPLQSGETLDHHHLDVGQ